jgi:glutaredoxin-related protein
MKRFPIIAVVVTLAVIVGGVLLFSRNSISSQTPSPTAYEYFYGNGCPHCANVNEFLSTWDGLNKINLEKKEVYSNNQNAEVMATRAASCGIVKSELGVPFLYTPDGKCLMGDQPIIDYFKNLEL